MESRYIILRYTPRSIQQFYISDYEWTYLINEATTFLTEDDAKKTILSILNLPTKRIPASSFIY